MGTVPGVEARVVRQDVLLDQLDVLHADATQLVPLALLVAAHEADAEPALLVGQPSVRHDAPCQEELEGKRPEHLRLRSGRAASGGQAMAGRRWRGSRAGRGALARPSGSIKLHMDAFVLYHLFGL